MKLHCFYNKYRDYSHREQISLILLCLMIFSLPAFGKESIIVEAKGQSCANKGEVKERDKQQALNDAMIQAKLVAARHVAGQAGILDTHAANEILAIYQKAKIGGIDETRSEKFRNAKGQKCISISIQAEIIPGDGNEAAIRALTGTAGPLSVEIIPGSNEYREGEIISFTIKGSKDFYGSIVYTDSDGSIIQIYPNKYHPGTKFDGNHEYRLPYGKDFEISVSPPFGKERISVYAATVPLGELGEIVPTGKVEAEPAPGLGMQRKQNNARRQAIEYVEKTVTLETRPGN